MEHLEKSSRNLPHAALIDWSKAVHHVTIHQAHVNGKKWFDNIMIWDYKKIKSKVSGYTHFEMKLMLVKIWKFCTRLRRALTWHTANIPGLTVHNSLLVLRTNSVYLHNNQACITVSERHDWCVDVVTVSVQHGVTFDAPGGRGAFSTFLWPKPAAI